MKINRNYKVINLDQEKFLKDSLKSHKIAVTGTLKYFSRTGIKNVINNLGGQFLSNVTKETSFLIVGEESVGKKLDKAQSLNLKIISEEDFLELILQTH